MNLSKDENAPERYPRPTLKQIRKMIIVALENDKASQAGWSAKKWRHLVRWMDGEAILPPQY